MGWEDGGEDRGNTREASRSLNLFQSANRYWHTLQHLRPVQIYGRLWFRLYNPRPQTSCAPPLRTGQNEWVGCARTPRQLGPAQFRFIGQERSVDSASDWNRSDWPKLWLYNLHYFDDLVADGAEQRQGWHRNLIARWIAENPPGNGNGWEPYPISLRLVNWCKWLIAGNEPVDSMLDSMAVQIRFLRGRLERHLLGNHLWANLKALAFAGTFFQGEEADRWRQQGLKLLRRELADQILRDGGHFERSPMYHAILLEDLLDLIQLDSIYPGVLPAEDVRAWREKAAGMLGWLQVMTHPDGELSFFNDAAFDIAPALDALLDYSRAVGLDCQPISLDEGIHLESSGYVRLQRGPAVTLIDAAPVGPDYLPGHAHADTLSFELSLGGRRLLVNAGTSTYQNDAQRRLERSTAMHNTVTVDGQDSSEVWGAFRVARRARVSHVDIRRSGGEIILEAGHDGYQRLPGKVTHRRRWRISKCGLTIEDELEGAFHEATARFRLAPDVEVSACRASQGQLSVPGFSASWACEGGEAMVEDGHWHPRFGASVPCKVLVINFRGNRLRTIFEWREESRG